MQRKNRFILGGVLLAAAVLYLIYSAVSETSVYYLTIDEFVVQKDRLVNEGVRVAGRVQDGTVQWDAKSLHLRFALADFKSPNDAVRIEYTGILPDMFGDGRDVIVEGKYGADGVFRARTILTSCPSKYEAKKPAT